ncbi:MAG: Gfo/Idh/MocA family oxidoreductase [Alicyclobacillus herbarius]|uniref:Gfo/Idh/MocA family protein n=1 Tax=Alicyclobacillus herbarius TaxID=122960 RepID=UPI0023564250|nr:Gfo/Idh/MocA family oxidoreductase [Alicyclobacillus herbarius]MCL6633592.1 Gfo/Idh/MocA family oxidoreductase [Alicyclobacillus herbarius]
MDKLRFGLIGCGGISRIHSRELLNLDEAELVAVADKSPASAQQLGESLNVDWYSDHRDLLARDDIDVVNILTPSGTHAELVELAARHGKHVIVEKPLDVHLAPAERAIAACRGAGVKLAVISQHRFDQSTMRVKEDMATGKLGAPVLAQATVHWFRGQSYYTRSPGAGTWAMDGGGVLMIQALHTIDIMQYIMGPVESVMGHTGTFTHDGIEVEDTAVAILTFKNGALGTISATTSAYPGLDTRLEVIGEQGSAVIQNHILTRLYYREPGATEGMFGSPADNQAPEWTENEGNAHRRQFLDMINAIREDREPLVNGEESLHVLKVILAIYESARTGQRVYVESITETPV